MPVIFPSEFGLDCHFILDSAEEWRGFEHVSLNVFVFVLFACEGQRERAASVLTLVSGASNIDPVCRSTLGSFSTGRFHTGCLQDCSCKSYLAADQGY